MSRVPCALVWDPAVTGYKFRPDHPFNPRRLELAVSLIEALGLVDGGMAKVVPPRLATEAELLAVHSREYLDAVRRFSGGGDRAGAGRWGLGTDDTPIFPGMHDITALVSGATIRAAELVMRGEVTRAFSICGGLHHAHRDRASGFCVYSDLAAAIAWIRREHGGKVMYIDYDAHHGDGVQGIFYEDPDVLTLSLHESGRYLFPGTGFVDELGDGDGYGYSLNVPLEPFTEDDSWLDIHRKLIPEVMEAYRPDVVVLQSGCDGHAADPLTHLRASTRLYEETTRIVCEAADRVCGGRVIATGGGGYAVWKVVPRAWTLVWGVLSGQEVPNRIPHEWLNRWQGEAPEMLPPHVRDAEEDHRPVPRRAEIEATNRRTLESLRRQALPLIRGWGLGF
ncbi:acetoin utilization protein AcuC [Longimicrobium sp.]|uniref:acetoin utilization protein AcuC n=1 Tax=Longimicrobium sp. TaxID=2029185 RepID=UPI003B3B1DC5